MIRSFSIKNFRGFQELTIEPLQQVNLIAGKNNVGKTALLEALWLHGSRNNPSMGVRVDGSRGLRDLLPGRPSINLFRDFNTELEIELRASGDWKSEDRVLHMRLVEPDIAELSLGLAEGEEAQAQAPEHTVVMKYTDETGETFNSEGWIVGKETGAGATQFSFQVNGGQDQSVSDLDIPRISPSASSPGGLAAIGRP